MKFKENNDGFSINPLSTCVIAGTEKEHTQSDEVVTDACNITVKNISRNKLTSFSLPVTLWVCGTKAQAEALVDSGATSNFIHKRFVKAHDLDMVRLSNPYEVRNADGTENKNGRIEYYVRAYINIGEHASTHLLYVTDL